MGGSDTLVQGLVALWTQVRAGQVAISNDEIERITGRKAQNFEAFAVDHKAAFGG